MKQEKETFSPPRRGERRGKIIVLYSLRPLRLCGEKRVFIFSYILKRPMLKRILPVISAIFFAIIAPSCSHNDFAQPRQPPKLFSRVTHPDELKFSPLEVKIPKPDRMVLQNGLTVYLLEDNELPLMNINVLVRSGSTNDGDKSGVANLVARLSRTGGTVKYPIETLDENLEFISAQLKTSCDYEEMEISFSFLSRDFTACMDILKDILFAPLFPEDKLEKEKSRILEAIRRENDDPNSIAEREFRKLIYPAHPYGNQNYGNAGTIPLITVSDLRQFHQTHFIPSNMLIGFVGNIKKDDILALVKNGLEKITSPPMPPKQPVISKRIYNKSINLINKETNQSVIQFGHLGIERLNPDYFKVILMNAILGGTSISRLYDEIREQRGLAYDVYSYFSLSKDTGMFIVGTSTKNESVHQAISIIMQEIKKMQEDLVEEEELKNTKEGVLNGFVFRFENPSKIVEQYIFIEHMGLQGNYLETYRDNIMKVSREDIRQAAQKYLNLNDYILLVVGDSRKFDKPLSEFGKVNEIKLEQK